jgi:hypothetical protein
MMDCIKEGGLCACQGDVLRKCNGATDPDTIEVGGATFTKEDIRELVSYRVLNPAMQYAPDTVTIKRSDVLSIALECGFSISTAYGQGIDKLMPISDDKTLEYFANKILETALEKK